VVEGISTGDGGREDMERWDSEVINDYLARVAPQPAAPASPCDLTLQGAYARALILVVADLAVRASRELGSELARLDGRMMRDCAIGVGVRLYIAAVPKSNGYGDSALADRIVAGLVVRRDPVVHAGLLRLSVELPGPVRDELDREVDRVLARFSDTDLTGWHGDLVADVRSSVVEAITPEWMHMRAEAFGISHGLDSAARLPRPERARRRTRERPH
jgi:hypothetical protein